MKKLLYTFILVGSMSLSGCSGFVNGYDISPNSPTNVSINLLLPSAELGLQAAYTGSLDRNASVFTQQLAGTQYQMLDVASYVLREGDNTNDWNVIYTNVVQTTNDLISKAGTDNPYYVGIAKVLKAMALGLATDVWGDVPASEAGLGVATGNLTPKYDAQKDILVYIQGLLDDAITQFGTTASQNKLTPGSNDLLYGGDISQWKNLAYAIKARYANRLSKSDPQGSATNVLTYLNKIQNFKNFAAIYGSATQENNQWYAFQQARKDYIKMGKFFVDTLISLNDPRLPFYAALNSSGVYKGSPANSTDLTASNIGPFVNKKDAPIYLVTNAELLFMSAEANFRLGNKGQAATDFNNAVAYSINLVTGVAAPATYITANASETAASINLHKIMTHKYLAMFINVESWSDWRRTGYPLLTPNNSSAVAIQGIPRRYPVVLDERNYNPNAVLNDDILKPVWWDSGSN